jgi:hypothetical protein
VVQSGFMYFSNKKNQLWSRFRQKGPENRTEPDL